MALVKVSKSTVAYILFWAIYRERKQTVVCLTLPFIKKATQKHKANGTECASNKNIYISFFIATRRRIVSPIDQVVWALVFLL